MRKGILILCAFVFLAVFANAQTSTVSGVIYDPSAAAGQNVQLKFVLQGCAGNAPRYNGNYLITGETDGANVVKIFNANTSTGVVSGTIVRSDYITCGSSTASNYWAMYVVRNGVKGPACNVRITASSFDANTPNCLNQNPAQSVSNSLAADNIFTGDNIIYNLNGECTPTAFTGAAIQSCIDSLTSGGIVRLQRGTYTVTSTINMNQNHVCMVGAHWGSLYLGNVGATTLNVASGVTGIDVTGYWNCLKGFFLYSASTGSGSDIGIRLRGPAPVVENVAVKNFGSWGLTCDSSGSLNVDFFRIQSVALYGNRGGGAEIGVTGGTDCNAGTVINLNVDSNTGVGLKLTAGAVNNTFIATHASNNSGGDYDVSTQSNYFFDTYCEGGTGSSFTLQNTASANRIWFATSGQCSTLTPNSSGYSNQWFYMTPEALPGQSITTIAPLPGATSPTTYSLRSGHIANSVASLKDDTNGVNIWRYDPGTGFKFLTNLAIGTSGTFISAQYSGTASLDYDLSAAGITCQDLTITVTGASTGDTVKLGIPDALASTAGVVFSAWVSATDTVKVRACDVTSGNPNPAAATVRAEVTHY